MPANDRERGRMLGATKKARSRMFTGFLAFCGSSRILFVWDMVIETLTKNPFIHAALRAMEFS
jgi:hypothetical protein